jgi:hypothetical protein
MKMDGSMRSSRCGQGVLHIHQISGLVFEASCSAWNGGSTFKTGLSFQSHKHFCGGLGNAWYRCLLLPLQIIGLLCPHSTILRLALLLVIQPDVFCVR